MSVVWFAARAGFAFFGIYGTGGLGPCWGVSQACIATGWIGCSISFSRNKMSIVKCARDRPALQLVASLMRLQHCAVWLLPSLAGACRAEHKLCSRGAGAGAKR